MVNLFVPMGGFACLTESGVCFRYVAKKTLYGAQNEAYMSRSAEK